ncbi:MAG: type I pantothenate kinase [Candidatus Arsenophonus melophagi]|nr:type I pantothenate kinase [Candidatus Arsenophonus melophagi]
MPYLEFDREHWATLGDSVPLELLTDKELLKLKGINDNLSMDEVNKIYLPISRLLNLYISANVRRKNVLEQFLGTLDKKGTKVPYVIGIVGSVAAGKSTTARVLKTLLSRWPEHRTVDLLTTDGFLYPNRILKKRGLMKKKGFPQSYDMHRLVKFISDIKSGVKHVTAPIYSHLTYDIIPDKKQVIKNPDILIFEGLNILQSAIDYPYTPYQIFISDFIDFSIYVDAPENFLKKWYISRFLKFCKSVFLDPQAYFYHYSKLEQETAIKKAKKLWEEINKINLEKNIIPTKERANLIMIKGVNHAVRGLRLKK